MHLSTTIEQLTAITNHINAHIKKLNKQVEAYPQELKLTVEGGGDILVEYDIVSPGDTRGVPYRFSVKLDGKKAS